ncbi:hypothetical protein Snoj_41090 [Streptomyces nojiriensis]|uniref:Uncharacterized protein n=1 Tax=Streptomyces nojiriensis TaxID=66374 RepID=A0ABQ3SPY5_9ACTN|nr:hypothetical protein GCM10010205_09740 [Streptomyces nojiriensis]GHI70191.1 hypothetical protein Snoj_41090 [Streptomyces nojiriensis]
MGVVNGGDVPREALEGLVAAALRPAEQSEQSEQAGQAGQAARPDQPVGTPASR